MRRTVVVLLLLASCTTGRGAAWDALINTAIGVTFSAARRAQGDCYVECISPRICNERTGLCELPCGGCAENEICRPDGLCALAEASVATSSTSTTVPGASISF